MKSQEEWVGGASKKSEAKAQGFVTYKVRGAQAWVEKPGKEQSLRPEEAQSSKTSKRLTTVLEIQKGRGLMSESSSVLLETNIILLQILYKFKWLTLTRKPDNSKNMKMKNFMKLNIFYKMKSASLK